MSSQGYIYVLINPAMPGLLKIGLTTKTPEERVKELSSATGVPINFILIYKEFFLDCVSAEKAIHAQLEAQGFRLNKGREFFEAEPSDVVDVIKSIKAVEKELVYDDSDEEIDDSEQQPWEYYQSIADDYYYGLDDKLQDYAEAYANYLKAFELMSPTAHRALGEMLLNGEGVRVSPDEALKYFKAGVERGDDSCWYDIAIHYHKQGHGDNFVKSVLNLLKTYNVENELHILQLFVIMSSTYSGYISKAISADSVRDIYGMIDFFKTDILSYLKNLDELNNLASFTSTLIRICSVVGKNEDILSYSQICMVRLNDAEQIKRDCISWESLGMVEPVNKIV